MTADQGPTPRDQAAAGAGPTTPGTTAEPGPAAAWLSGHADELRSVVDQLVADGNRLDAWGAHLGTVLAGGGRLLTAGNGGSAAEAQHLTAELVGRFVGERRPLSAIALHADTSSVTAVANDYGAHEVFARGVTAHGRPGDVLLLLSASGRSENVLAAAAAARQAGLVVWSLTGPGPNPLREVSDDAVCLEAPTTSAVQEGHLVAVHALCAAVDARVRALDAAERAVTPAGTGAAAETGTGGTATVRAGAQRTGAPRTGAQSPTDGARPPSVPAPSSPSPSTDGPVASSGTRAVRLVVVGDVVLDRDVLGSAERVAPDAPVPVVDVGDTHESPGGAGLTALLCEDAGVSVTLVAPLADDDAGARLRAALEAGGVGVQALGHEGATRTKTRVRVAGQSLVRLDDGGSGAPLAVDAAALRQTLAGADVVLVSDYGAGTTREPAVRSALEGAAARVPVVWDPHPRGGEPVAGCALVTPNAAEAIRVLGDAAAEPQQTSAALRRRWGAGGVAVTAGARGAFLSRAAAPPPDALDTVGTLDAALYVPAPPVASGDPAGAGDRFAASAAIALARGADPASAVAVAVGAASAWVDAGGASGWRERARRAESGDPCAPPQAGAGPSSSGPSSDGAAQAALALAERVRATGGSLVATGGCFDVLHAGHVTMLAGAARLGDALVVLLNSDASVRRLKGAGRPVNTAADRAEVLLALGSVDAVLVFDEDDPRDALAGLRPHVWVKGGDYAVDDLPEAPLVRGWGGEVVLLPHLAGRSTTSTLARGAALDPPPDHHLTEAPA